MRAICWKMATSTTTLPPSVPALVRRGGVTPSLAMPFKLMPSPPFSKMLLPRTATSRMEPSTDTPSPPLKAIVLPLLQAGGENAPKVGERPTKLPSVLRREPPVKRTPSPLFDSTSSAALVPMKLLQTEALTSSPVTKIPFSLLPEMTLLSIRFHWFCIKRMPLPVLGSVASPAALVPI